MPSFRLFGCSHLVVLALIALVAALTAALIHVAREGKTRGIVRAALIGALAALAAHHCGRAAVKGWLSAEPPPMRLCDTAMISSVFSLTTGNRLTNFLYLRQNPEQPASLDAFGMWPFSIAVRESIAPPLFRPRMPPFRIRLATPARWSDS
ncbi:MAG: hypothetical protein JXO72_13360 [Vicinamibacteria bacterium]|nr:hypothetical protein [Vicinamibacteria bacterium]